MERHDISLIQLRPLCVNVKVDGPANPTDASAWLMRDETPGRAVLRQAILRQAVLRQASLRQAVNS